jgi:hypothetical protein
MQRIKIYNDLLHLTGEWMNADMLNRGTEDRPPSLSLFLGGANVPSAPLCSDKVSLIQYLQQCRYISTVISSR